MGGGLARRTLEVARLAVITVSACSGVRSPELLYFALDEGNFPVSFCRGKLRFSPFSASPKSVSRLNRPWRIDDLSITQSGSLLRLKGFDDL